jgi:hypothetical protein
MRQLRGVAHVHSTYSFDGRLTLAELAEFFAKRGIHFVLMSEHMESLDAEKLRSFIADCGTYSGDSFLLIPGIEIDDLNALFYNVQPLTGWRDCRDLAGQLAAGGALVGVSHPVKIRTEIPDITKSLVEGVEIWNSRHDGKMALDGRNVRYWRSLRRRAGRDLAPLCGIDFHDKSDFARLFLEVQCESLDAQCIMAAVRAKRYRITLGEKPIPLDFVTGRLPTGYWVYVALYRLVYKAVYSAHRTITRRRYRVPAWLKSRLRRIF